MQINEAIKVLISKGEISNFRLPTEAEIANTQEELGIKLHSDYKLYLLKASNISYGTLEPGQITNKDCYTYLPSILESAREYEVPSDLLPFCADNADFYCLNNKGEVVFWSHDGASNEKWPSLGDWIVEVLIKEYEETEEE